MTLWSQNFELSTVFDISMKSGAKWFSFVKRKFSVYKSWDTVILWSLYVQLNCWMVVAVLAALQDSTLLEKKWSVAGKARYYTKIGKSWTNSCSITNQSVQYLGILATLHFLSNSVSPYSTTCSNMWTLLRPCRWFKLCWSGTTNSAILYDDADPNQDPACSGTVTKQYHQFPMFPKNNLRLAGYAMQFPYEYWS